MMKTSWWAPVTVCVIAGLAVLPGPASAAPVAAPAGGAPFAAGPPPLAGKFAEKAKKAEALAAKAAKDPKSKAPAVKANYELGHELMLTNDLPPYKYRYALKYLRAAAKLDPKNKPAKADIDQIESVYKQMGRPIPQ